MNGYPNASRRLDVLICGISHLLRNFQHFNFIKDITNIFPLIFYYSKILTLLINFSPLKLSSLYKMFNVNGSPVYFTLSRFV